jgi:glycosyltransferase involved in cell wall biosynthesis
LPGLGVDVAVWELAFRLSRRGHRIRVFANTADPAFTQDSDIEVTLLGLPFSRRLPVFHRATIADLRKRLKSGTLPLDPDEICVLATEPFYPLTRVFPRCVILYFGNSPPLGLGWKGRLNYAYAVASQRLWSFRAAATILSCSYFVHRSLSGRLRRKGHVLYPGVNHYDRWTPSDAEVIRFRGEFGVAPNDLILFYAGRLNPFYQPYKGLRELISHYQALKTTHPGLHLMVAGYGDESDEAFLKNQGVKVFRNAPRQMMPLLFKTCDIYCTASRWEGFDLPLAEAQHFGKPVLAYEVGAHPEILYPNDSGYLVENPASFRSTLEFMLENRPWCREMGDRGRHRVARFRWEYSVVAFETHLHQVFGGR